MTASLKTFNPWPAGIILAFALFIPATLGLAIFTTFHKSDLVSADYYEQEIRYQTRIDRLNRTRPLAGSLGVSYDVRTGFIELRLPVEHARPDLTGTVHLYRPSAAGLDREFPLNPDSHGAQRLDAQTLAAGLWKIALDWRAGNQDYRFEESVVVTPTR